MILGGYVGELGRTRAVGGEVTSDESLWGQWRELWDRLIERCQVGVPLSGLLDAYDAAGVPPPPMPVARGLGLGFDLPLVTHVLPVAAVEENFEAGMVFSLTAYVWKEGRRRALCPGTGVHQRHRPGSAVHGPISRGKEFLT